MRRYLLFPGLLSLLLTGCRVAEFGVPPARAAGITMAGLVSQTDCGTFTPQPLLYTGGGGMWMTLNFLFDLSKCQPTSAPCDCSEVVYVQIVRISDITYPHRPRSLIPAGEYRDRMVTGTSSYDLDGWTIDQGDTLKWGYYGRNDDGSFDSGLARPGSNTQEAVLYDGPGGFGDGNDTLFEAVSVPVCIHGAAACENGLAGYHYWGYRVEGGVTTLVSGPIEDHHRRAFELAVEAWDTHAAGLHKHRFPAFRPLP